MAQGVSIHIGLNRVDPDQYGGWDGQLSGCINDANDMQGIADSLGYNSSTLIDDEATASAICAAIRSAALSLTSGDILLLTYSGHGGQVNDADSDDEDGKDETWCLFDRELIDDELNALWAQFASGVRIFVLSDSCHSGTVLRMRMYQDMAVKTMLGTELVTRGFRGVPAFRLAPPDLREIHQRKNRALYEAVQSATRGRRAAVAASVLLISGCLDSQLSMDGSSNGLFTQTLKSVWNNGAFTGSYQDFWRAIVAAMPATQSPNFYRTGVTNAAFEAQRPFTISPPSSVGQVPTIEGPASIPIADGSPRFRVNPGPGRYFAVEVATEAALFNYAQNGARRTDSNFYGSWRTLPFHLAPSYPTEYALPDTVWQRLKSSGATELFYRLWATSGSNSWISQRTTVSDAQAASAPCIRLTAAQSTTVPSSAAVPSISAESVPVGTPPRFRVNPGTGKYFAVEIATRADLLNHEAIQHRNDDNFYASWKTRPFGYASAYPAVWTMPSAAWLRLSRSSGRLYYRLWSTDVDGRWVNQRTTTPDSQAMNAPSLATRSERGQAASIPSLEERRERVWCAA